MIKNINLPVLLSTAYLPNIQYVSKILHYKKIIIDVHETYLKQSFRNRCQISSANGILDLSIPIIKPDGNKTKTKDIEIEYVTNWRQIHWRALVSAYKNSPFFEIFEEELAHIFVTKEKYLIDFNQKILQQLFNLLGATLQIEMSDNYITDKDSEFDFRNSIHPKKRMQKSDPNFVPREYYQVFNKKMNFLPNLSFIDLMFNEGPQAIETCLSSIQKK
jgi:hypothetical protein